MKKDKLDINIRLIPTLIVGGMNVAPINHTESGIFSLLTYLVPVNIKGDMIDLNTGKVMVRDGDTYALYANIHWMGQPVQRHLVTTTDENNVNEDCFSLEEGKKHSMVIHQTFGMYMDGSSPIFPSLRAFGWAFVPFNEIVAIQMWEQRAVQKVLASGSYEFDNMVDWAVLLDIMNEDQDRENQKMMLGEYGNDDDDYDEKIGEISWKITDTTGKEEVDNIDPLEINLNSNVRKFLDNLEYEGQDDDEKDGSDSDGNG